MKAELWIGEDRFCKRFFDSDELKKELQVYQKQLPMTARLISAGGMQIDLSLLQGRPYLDTPLSFFPGLLGRTLAAFHQSGFDGSKCWCHWDNNPKNILLSEDLTAYYLVDFAQLEFDFPEADLTHLLLFWIQHFNDEQLRRFTKLFINAYTLLMPIDKERWNQHIPLSIRRFNQRRIDFGKAPDLLLNNTRYIQHLIGL